jgi:LacI family transcriptional regulator
MTVSRVVNGEQNVRESTRERVREAIAALNYVPNPAARRAGRLGAHPDRRPLQSNPSAGYLSEFHGGL